MNDTLGRISALERLSKLTPDNPALLATLAAELIATKRQDTPDYLNRPIELLQRCIEISGRQDERYYIRLASVLAAAERFTEAGEAYAAALTLRSTYEAVEETMSDDQLAYLAAENYLNGHQVEQAAAYVERLQELNPQHASLPDSRLKAHDGEKGQL